MTIYIKPKEDFLEFYFDSRLKMSKSTEECVCCAVFDNIQNMLFISDEDLSTLEGTFNNESEYYDDFGMLYLEMDDSGRIAKDIDDDEVYFCLSKEISTEDVSLDSISPHNTHDIIYKILVSRKLVYQKSDFSSYSDFQNFFENLGEIFSNSNEICIVARYPENLRRFQCINYLNNFTTDLILYGKRNGVAESLTQLRYYVRQSGISNLNSARYTNDKNRIHKRSLYYDNMEFRTDNDFDSLCSENDWEFTIKYEKGIKDGYLESVDDFYVL